MGQNVNQAQAKLFERMSRWFAAPVLTRGRIWFAYAVAVATDTVQLMLGPLGWAFIDEGLDVVAMILTSRALGFHMLLLPTFVAEFIPVIDMLPTWTACTATVIMLRKKTQAQPPGQPQPPVIDPIDISSEVRRAPAKEQPDGRP